MRLTWKAAAVLLTPIVSLAHALPGDGALVKVSKEEEGGSPSPLVLHGSSAIAKISVPCHECFEPYADDARVLIFDIQALESEKPCGLSNVRINRQALDQEWDGTSARGSGLITTQQGLGINTVHASWTITCIFDTVPTDGSNSQGDDVAQILTFTVNQVNNTKLNVELGFTVSFKQLTPEILRISPLSVPAANEATSTEESRDPLPSSRWSSPTADNKEPSLPASIEDEITQLRQLKAEAKELKRLIKEKQKTIKALIREDCKSFRAEIEQCDDLRCIVKAMFRKAHGALRMLCHRFKATEHDHPVHHVHQHPSTPEGGADSHPAAPTAEGEGSPNSHHKELPHSLLRELEDDDHDSLFHRIIKALKISAIILVITSFFGLVFKLCRTPRHRSDCAARREECRNRRLYRRAACKQKFHDWFCRRNRVTSEYDEKRSLIISQESILESAMQAEIHELRKAHEVVNDMVRAEEGRYVHELDGGLPRRHSLPDYESRSESGLSEPPSYEDQIAGESVVDGFQYTPQGTDFTPASSVVDTSPRISLDSRETRDFV